MIDEKGDPVSGITVREAFQDYSYEFVGGGTADALTDSEGKIHFPLRTKWEIIGGLLVHGVLSLPGFVHNSYGVHSDVFAFGDGIRGDWEEHGMVGDWTGEPRTMTSTILVKPDSAAQ